MAKKDIIMLNDKTLHLNSFHEGEWFFTMEMFYPQNISVAHESEELGTKCQTSLSKFNLKS